MRIGEKAITFLSRADPEKIKGLSSSKVHP
jgi:hypothetical protein